jgi:hypothetical protein
VTAIRVFTVQTEEETEWERSLGAGERARHRRGQQDWPKPVIAEPMGCQRADLFGEAKRRRTNHRRVAKPSWQLPSRSGSPVRHVASRGGVLTRVQWAKRAKVPPAALLDDGRATLGGTALEIPNRRV